MSWFKIDKLGIAHEDERRAMMNPFNGDFIARQVKVLKIKKNSTLGNHYHDYYEMFYILKGKAQYWIKDIQTEMVHSGILKEGDRLIIEPRVAHKFKMLKGTVTIEATEKPYISAEYNDRRYDL